LCVNLIRDTQTWRQILERVLDRTAQGHTIFARNQHFTGMNVQPATLVFSGYGLRIIDFPSQSVVHSQLGGYLPSILAVVEGTPLPFARIERVRDISLETAYFTQHETCNAESAAARTLCKGRCKEDFPGAMLVAGHTEILQAPDVRPKLDGVVAPDPCPVAHILKLLHFFNQRAVAVVIQTVAEVEACSTGRSVTLNVEVRHAVGCWIVRDVQSGRSRVGCEGAQRQWIHKNTLPVKAKAEIHEQGGLKGVVKPERVALWPG